MTGVRVFRYHVCVVGLELIRLVFLVSTFSLVAIAHDIVEKIAVTVFLVAF